MRFLRRLLPDTMVGQAILVLLLGLTVSHLASMVIYSGERVESLALLGGRNMAQRAANITHLVAEAPPDWRQRLVAGLDEPGFRVSVTRERPLVGDGSGTDGSWRTEMIRRYVESLVSPDRAGSVRVRLLDLPEHEAMPEADWMPAHMRMMLRGAPFNHRLQLSIRLADGAWLDFDGAIPEPPSLWSGEAMMSMLLMAVAVVVFTIWVVRRLTRPMRALAHAAERLGRDVAASPMPEVGPREVRQAARAFNDMQEKLRRLIENRTRMLAAISHDLRTPITLLRLRAELIEGEEDRQKTLATLDEMEKMIAATLAFARDDAETETRKVVDLAALVDAICTDLADAGGEVACEAPEHLAYECAPVAMRRALTNLVDNALKYGKRARVRLAAANSHVVVTIEDEGPGIPEDRLEDVFAPFVRVEESRNADTGGVGLGLSVARSVVHAHGGEVSLANRPEGGLLVRLTLPR